MRFWVLFLAGILIYLSGCSTSEPLTDRFPDLVQVTPPERVPYVEKELSISSIELVSLRKGKALHIKGQFPNACTSILRAEGNVTFGILEIDMVGWQLYKQECEQSASEFPFSYLFTGVEQWEDVDKVYINEKEFVLNQ